MFIAHAAHELRSPLTALYGELALALRRSRDADEYRAAIGEALDSTRQLKGLAEDLLAVARLGTAPPPSAETIDVRQTVEEAKRIVLQAEGRRASGSRSADKHARFARANVTSCGCFAT